MNAHFVCTRLMVSIIKPHHNTLHHSVYLVLWGFSSLTGKKNSESVLRKLGRMTNRLQHNREPKKRVDKSFAILQGRDAHTKWLPHFVFSQNGCSGGQGPLQKHLFSQKANLGGVVVPISFLLQCFLPTLVCYIFF